MAERVCVAQIGAAHGVRGEVRLKSFTEDPMSVMRYGPFETEDGIRVDVEKARPVKDDMLVARLKGVADRNAAEALKHVKLYVPRARLPKPAADEFYHADLIGLAVSTVSGAALGTIKAVHNFGAGDVIEIEPAAGGPTLMLPFSEDAVPTVDIANRHVIVADAFVASE